MTKIISYGKEARSKILDGVSKVADAVKVTMGPKGRNVIIQTRLDPKVTNDGVSVAREVFTSDLQEGIGVSLIKRAAEKTNRAAGDGTTSTVVLAEAIMKEGADHIEDGLNQFELVNALNKYKDILVEELNKLSNKVTSDNIRQIATVSSQDEEVGKLIEEIIEETGEDGVVNIQEGDSRKIEKEVKRGLLIQSGFTHYAFVKNAEKMETVINKPLVIVMKQSLSTLAQLEPIFKFINERKYKKLVIFAEEFEGDALTAIAHNVQQKGFEFNCIKLPGFSETKQGYIDDICTVTGATVIDYDIGSGIKELNPSVFGEADTIKTGLDETIVINDNPDIKNKVLNQITTLKGQLKKTKDNFMIDELEKRIASLAGGVAIIKVGAATEIEMRNKKDKIEDALHATKSAIKEGYVAGGGTTLAKLSQILKGLEVATVEEKVVLDILIKALQYPMTQIIRNGYKDVDDRVKKIMKEESKEYGLNVKTGEYGDLIKMGIIDPTKVIRVSLDNAISVASMFLTSECMITQDPESIKNK